MKMNIGRKRRGRPKKRWLDTNENDMRTVGLCVEDVKNRDNWRFKTKVADSK